MFINKVAKTCHEANRALCEAFGDTSQTSWEDAPEWQTKSARNGVLFHISNPKAGDSASHDNWSKEKVADGWVYGEEKDADLKTHPCLVPFEELPPVQQAKDRIFRRIVHAMIGA
tara:strand:- start:2453 stop:2797 length:345 start_codon:yes stop_codon:yes gene_type:complete